MRFAIILTSILFSLATTANEGGRDNGALFPQPTKDQARGTQPDAPTIVSPAFNATTGGGNVELKWNSVKNANGYHLQVAKDPNFKWLVAEQNPMTETTFTVTGLEKGKTYFWRVAAYTLGNHQSYSKSWFTKSSFR